VSTCVCKVSARCLYVSGWHLLKGVYMCQDDTCWKVSICVRMTPVKSFLNQTTHSIGAENASETGFQTPKLDHGMHLMLRKTPALRTVQLHCYYSQQWEISNIIEIYNTVTGNKSYRLLTRYTKVSRYHSLMIFEIVILMIINNKCKFSQRVFV